ncbi:MAG: pyridoxamine 5'-phosphate oxidase family protein [Betaproteobacteria bacterium]
MTQHPPALPAEPSRSQAQGAGSFAATGMLDLPQDAPQATDEAREQLFERLKKTPVAMVVTTDRGGGVRIRPLTTQQAQKPGILWFFIAVDGGVADDVGAQPEVILTYAEPGDNAYVALAGRASVVVDPAKAKELWSPIAGAWFNQGPDDPRLALLRVELDRGEAWESTEGKVLEFLRMAKAAVTRTPPDHSHDHFVFSF